MSTAQASLQQLASVQRTYEQLAARRQQAIVEALQAGNSLRSVAELANCSYESVRRLAGPNAAVFEWKGSSYVMTDHATRVLAYKADGFALGRFANESAEQVRAGKGWQQHAGELARQLERNQRGELSTIRLNRQMARALYLILTATFTGRPNRLSDLYDDLRASFGS